jgi:hypothetical protein
MNERRKRKNEMLFHEREKCRHLDGPNADLEELLPSCMGSSPLAPRNLVGIRDRVPACSQPG